MAKGGTVIMFMGEYSHTIDAKGRIIVPAKFRESLGDNIVVTKGLDNCLFVYTSEDWRKFEEKLRTLPLTNKDARKFTRFFLAGAAEMEIDKQVVALVKQQHEKAAKILAENKDKLDELAKYLYEKETITGEEFMHILNGNKETEGKGK